MNQALETQNTQALILQAPEQVLADAKRASLALMQVINAKPKKIVMNGETYLEVDDWNLLARFFNCAARVKSTEFLDYGEVQGFEAKAEVVNLADGSVVSAADAMCLDDEANWGERPKYEWKEDLDGSGKIQWVDDGKGGKRPKKIKTQVGSEPTPLFQLRSMAQTRACSKALRLAFSWIVVLANNDGAKLSRTPAEELDDNTIDSNGNGKPEVAQPQKSEARTGKKISEGQRKRMFAMAREAGFDPDTRVKQVTEAYGYANPGDVVMGKKEGEYDFICQCITNKTWEPPVAAKPKPTPLTPVTIEGKCKGINEVPADGDKDSFIVAHFEGKEVHCFDHRTFDKVRKMPDKVCKLGCGMKEGYPDKVKLLAIFKIGDEEWLEDGTPVIQQGKQ